MLSIPSTAARSARTLLLTLSVLSFCPGPSTADTTPPSSPTSIGSPSHALSTWFSDPTIDVQWSGAADGESGVAGYSVSFGSLDWTLPPTFLSSFGSHGTGNGQFTSVTGVAVTEAGEVYVAGSHRIQKFTSAGSFVSTWGGFGSGVGQFSNPLGLALSGSGELFVADEGNDRVQKFDPTGGFLLAWGSTGSGPGQFSSPTDVALDGAGNVYVADSGNARIQIFDGAGTFLSEWTSPVASEPLCPFGLALDGGGNVFVSENCRERILKLDPAGDVLLSWGSSGSGPGELVGPLGVAVDDSGNVYVADTGNERIQRFDSSGSFLATWGTGGTGAGQFDFPAFVAVRGSEEIYVSDWLNFRLQAFRQPGLPDAVIDIPHTTDPHAFTSPALADGDSHSFHLRTCDGAGNCTASLHLGPFWVDTMAPDNPTSLGSSSHLEGAWSNDPNLEVEWSGAFDPGSGLAGYSVALDTEDPEDPPIFKREWGSHGAADGRFNLPRGVTVDALGKVYVADTSNHRVQVFDSSGGFLTKWGSLGSGAGQLIFPEDVAVSESGTVYVADRGNDRIQVFDSSGSFVAGWGSSGTGNGQFQAPGALALDASGNLFVADTNNHRIQVFDPSGAFLTKWGSSGTGNGQFRTPTGLAVDIQGNVYVADGNNHRVQVFDPSGTFLFKWGSRGAGDGQLDFPWRIEACGSWGICVADYLNDRVQVFDLSGAFITKWGSAGSGAGDFQRPIGVAVDGSEDLYVVDSQNHRIQVFHPSGLPDTTAEVTHTTDPHTFTGASLADGSGSFFHLRTCDTAGNCSGAAHLGPYRIDTTAPEAPTGLMSTSHTAGVWSASPVVTMSWTPGSDALSGLDGYAYELSPASAPACSRSKNLEEGVTGLVSEPLADGTWWFHLCAVDVAGNWSPAVTAGPFLIDRALPTNPTSLASPSHTLSTWSSDPTVEVQWSGAADGGSGVAGYSLLFDDEAPGGPPTFLTKWGSSGGAAGQLVTPFLLAVDTVGNVYVADFGNDRIQKFDAAGNFLDQWGSFGTGAGEFILPQGVAVDAAGDVYVADTDNHRIQKLDAAGNFLTQWGSFGSGDGEFAFPVGIAVGPGGDVYVADNNNHRVQRFDATGAFVAQWGGNGAGAGELTFPTGMAVDAGGDVYVVDSGNDRVQKFDSSGSYLARWGTTGTGEGQFQGPFGVTVGPSGNVYVADTGNHRVQKFDGAGSFLFQWGTAGSGDGQFTGLRGIAAGPSGLIYTADSDSTATRIQAFVPPGLPDATMEVPHTADPHAFIGPTLSDSEGHYVHLRTCDTVGLCSAALHLGPFWVDTTAPDLPTDLVSTSHTPGVPTPVAVIDMSWTPPTDGRSGLDGYAYEFNQVTVGTCDQGKDLEEGATSVSSEPLAPGTWLFHLCAVDEVGNWSLAATSAPFVILAPPGDPTAMASPSHPPGAWGGERITVEWSGAVDQSGSGLAGYSVAFDHDPTGLPDATVDVPQGIDPHGVTSPPLATGQDHWFHLRTCDGLGFCTEAVHLGPLWVDATLPDAPTALGSPSHGAGAWSNDPTVDVRWSGAFDAHSGLAGYSVAFEAGPSAAPPDLAFTWGNEGGVLRFPLDVAVDGLGYVYVADSFNRRIQKFHGDGTFLSAWGSYGTADGQFGSPQGVAVDGAGHVYVADAHNHRIQKFDASGAFLAKWGSSGDGAGQFSAPTGIAVDAAGHVYVVDSNNHRIQKFDASGTFLTAWGVPGTGDGQFDTPRGVTVDSAGNVYVADFRNHRIQKFDAAGSFLTQWGSVGSGDGQLQLPWDVFASPSGEILVSDSSNHRVQRFDASGTFLGTWGSLGSANGQFSTARGLAVGGDLSVYVADQGNARIQRFTSTGGFLGKWGTSYVEEGQFSFPEDVAADAAGNLYVADRDHHRIQKFDASGTFLLSWGSFGSADGQLDSPKSVAVDGAGNVYVADSGNHRIQKFDPSGTFLLAWGSRGSAPGQFEFPYGVAVDGAGAVYVADALNHRVQKFDANGGFLLEWGSNGSADGQLIVPISLATDEEGHLYVADSGNRRIQKFDSAGGFLSKWGSAGAGDGQFALPTGVAVDAMNRVYVADRDNHRIQVFDSSGRYLTQWGSHGAEPGQFTQPEDLGLDGAGRIYVADSFNHRIQVFGPPPPVDATVDLPHSTDPHTLTSPPLADGDGHVFHLRTCDSVGLCTESLQLGPFWVDATAPVNPPTVESTSHTVGESSVDATIDMSWSPASDGTSGVDGYAYQFSPSATPACDETLDLQETETAVTSAELADGAWIFHLCTVDEAGNWSPAVTAGPYGIDATAPRVTGVGSVAAAGSGGLGNTNGPLTQVLLTFSEEMDPLRAAGPAHYFLVDGGVDGVVSTSACGALQGDDLAWALELADYHAPSRTVRLHLPGDGALPEGSYRLFGCSSLLDLGANPLDGDGDGLGGDDFAVDVGVRLENDLLNPNFDLGLASWSLESSAPAEIGFSTEDADGAPSSGSVVIENLSGPGAQFAVAQCLALAPGRLSRARGRLRIASAVEGIPLFSVRLLEYETPDCSGAPAAVHESLAVAGDTGGAWVPFVANNLNATLPSMQSALLELRFDAGGETLLQSGLDALQFGETNVLFEDGFESGDASGWSRTVP